MDRPAALSPLPVSGAAADDVALVGAIRGGSEEAFAGLVDRFHAPLFRVALRHVDSRAVAEEVVQETWIGFLGSLPRFQARCSVKTWLFTILIRCARRAGARERRGFPVSLDGDGPEAGLAPLENRFFPEGHRWAGAWQPDVSPSTRPSVPEDRLLARETGAVVTEALAGLPCAQREVFLLRDVEGWTSADACAVLDVTAAHQRVLLHRARVAVRAAIETYDATG